MISEDVNPGFAEWLTDISVMDCLWLWFVLCLVPAARAVVGGAPASPPEPDSAVVFVQKYGRSARLEGIKNDKLGYYSFHGIR